MYCVYCLFSPLYRKIYVGSTIDIGNRLHWHNHKATKGYTIKYRPWEVVYTEECGSKETARLREQQLKTAAGRKFLWGLIESGS